MKKLLASLVTLAVLSLVTSAIADAWDNCMDASVQVGKAMCGGTGNVGVVNPVTGQFESCSSNPQVAADACTDWVAAQ